MKFNCLKKIINLLTISFLFISTNFALIKQPNIALDLLLQNQKELIQKLNPEISPDQRKSIENKALKTIQLKIVDSLFSTEQETAQKTFIDQDTLKNLHLFNNPQDAENTLFSKIDKTNTVAGSLTLAQMLSHATTEIADVKANQEIIKTLSQDPKLLTELDNLLKDFKTIEENFLKIHSQYPQIPTEEILKNLEKELKLFKQSNKQCGSFFSALKNKLASYKNSFVGMWNNKTATLANALFFYYPMITAYLHPSLNPTIGYNNPTFWISLLIKLFNSNPMTALIFMYMVGIPINEFFSLCLPFLAGGIAIKETGGVLKEAYWDNPAKQKLIETKFTEYAQASIKLLTISQKIYELISTQVFLQNLIKNFNDNKDQLSITKPLQIIGKLDAYLALAKLHTQEKYCLVDFTQTQQLNLKFEGLQSPLNSTRTLKVEINQKLSEINDAQLIQEISTAIILAHLGVAPAQKATITPLKYMHVSGQLNMLTVN